MASKSSQKRFRRRADNVLLQPNDHSESDSSDSDNGHIDQFNRRRELGNGNQDREAGNNVIGGLIANQENDVADQPPIVGMHTLCCCGSRGDGDEPMSDEEPNQHIIEEDSAHSSAGDSSSGEENINDVEPNQNIIKDGFDSDINSSAPDSSSDDENINIDGDVNSGSDQSEDEGLPGAARNVDNNNGNQPLYEGAPLTVSQSLIAIMTLVLTHGLTGSCLVDLLLLIALHCPPNNVLEYHYYCSNCYQLLQTKTTLCTSCQEKTKVAYFIEIPLVHQLQALFQWQGFYDKLQYRFNRRKRNQHNIEDIYDGYVYQQHIESGFLQNPNNISFMWYSDGVSVFNFIANKFNIWPLFLVINGLSYRERVKKQNIILAGIWFGTKKPQVNIFLAPFHSKFDEFCRDGYLIKLPDGRTIRVVWNV
ncbi:hypothetical protein FOCC_FOCC004050 [Frankliniella occidentalis]|nr:hypothetical protein FOCC_FOCC004050 [Frankliniella occidentalis]